MSNVSLTIGGRPYLVACAEGEESRIEALGAMIENKLVASGAAAHGEARGLLFAALLLADELQDARRNASSAPAPATPDLGQIAARLEKLASHLEEAAPSA